MKNSIKTSKLRLAQIRYFDSEHNGCEIPDMEAYALLANINDTYVNVLNPLEELPIYVRVPYSNTTIDGEDYGTKIMLLAGEVKDGACYVMEDKDISNLFGADDVNLVDIEKYVIQSNLLFPDRIHLLEEKVIPHSKKMFYYRLLMNDLDKMEKFDKYIERDKGYSYRK